MKRTCFVMMSALMLMTAVTSRAGAVGVGGTCGPIFNGACDQGLYCDRPAGACGLIGGTGKCVRIPARCPREQNRQQTNVGRPVCGCNGTTYPNDCERLKAMEQKAHDGPCK